MVTIINYTRRRKEDGTTFFVLEVHGGIEFIQSKLIYMLNIAEK